MIPQISDSVENLFSNLDYDKNFFNQVSMLEDGAITDQRFSSWVEGLTDVEKSSMSAALALDKYKKSLLNATSIGEKFKLGLSAAGDFIKYAGSLAINMAATMAVMQGFKLAVQGIDYLINYQDKLIEKGQKAKEAIESQSEAYNTQKSTLTELVAKYEELSSGVSISGNKIENKSLSTEEYEEFLRISNEIAATAPSLVGAWNSQGDAILSAGTNIQLLNSEAEKYLKVQRDLTHYETKTNVQDQYKGILAQSKKNKAEIAEYKLEAQNAKDKIDSLTKLQEAIQNNSGSYTFAADGDVGMAIRKAFSSNSLQYNYALENGGMGLSFDTNSINADTRKAILGAIEEIKNAQTIAMSEATAKLNGAYSVDQQNWQEIFPSIQTLVDTSAMFDGWDDSELAGEFQTHLSSMVSNMDMSTVSKGIEDSGGNIYDWVIKDVITPLSNASEQQKEVWNKLFTFDPGDMSVADAAKARDAILEEIADFNPNDYWTKETLAISFGYAHADEDGKTVWNTRKKLDEAQAAMENHGEEVREFMRSLSDEDFEIAYSIISSGDKDAIKNLSRFKYAFEKEKREVEKEPITFSSLLSPDSTGKQSELSSKVGDFQSNLSSIQNALNSIKNGDDIDLVSLTREFPELIGQTDNLEEALTSLKQKHLGDVISDIFSAAKEKNLSDSEMENVKDFVQNLIDGADISDIDLQNIKNAVPESIKEMFDDIGASVSIKLQIKNSSDLLSQVSAVKSALDSQSTGNSIDIQAFNSNELKDYQSALEYVNGTLHLNSEKVRELTEAKVNEQISVNDAKKAYDQAEYIKNAKEIETLREALVSKNYAEGESAESIQNQIDALLSENSAIVGNCQQLDLYNASLRESIGAYQAWIDSQNAPESGDMYDDAQAAMKALNEGLESGKTGTKKYEAAMDFLVPDEIPKSEVAEYMSKLEHYLSDSDIGTDNFLNDSVKAGLMTLENDVYSVADGVKFSDFVEKLHITPEMAHAIFGELEEYDFEFDWTDETFTSFGDGIVALEQSAEELQTELDKLNADKEAGIEVDDSEIQAVSEKLDAVLQKRAELNAASEANIESNIEIDSKIKDAKDEVEGWKTALEADPTNIEIKANLSEAEANLQRLQDEKSQLQEPTTVEITAAIEGIDSQIADVQTQINNLSDKEFLIKYGISEDTANSRISALQGQLDTLNGKKAEIQAYAETSGAMKDLEKLDNAKVDDKQFTVNVVDRASSILRNINNTVLRDKSFTITTNRVTHSGAQEVNGTAHANGTMYAGIAHVNGNWAAKTGGTTLIGELGREIVVDPNSGRWRTYGDNGAEFINLPKGAIVFNHKQTEALLERGFVAGRGAAMASGTAMVTGGGGKGINSGKKYNSSSSESNTKNSSKSDPKKSASKATKAIDKIIEALERLFDWIEVEVQRREERIGLYTARAENARTYQSKNSQITKAEKETKKLITTQTKASTQYQKQANAVAKKVGLSNGLKKRVDNGTIKIQSLSEDNRKRVEQYKKWVDKANAAKQAVEDLKQQQKELAQTKLDNIIDQYDSIVGLAEAAQDTSKAIVGYYTSAGREVNSAGAKSQIRSQMSQQNNITSNLKAQKNAYTAELNRAAKVFGRNSNEYREASTKLKELDGAIYESITAYNELNKQLFELDLTRIQHVITNLELVGDKMKNIVSLSEKRGSTIVEKDYTNQISNNNKIIEQYYSDWKSRQAKIAKEGWLPGSENYQEYYEAIMKDEQAIYSLLEGNEELKASIVSLRWKSFDDLHTKITQSIEDYDFLRELMKEESFFDDDGKVTSNGYANIALIGKAMESAKKQIADYRKALNKLDEEYRNGNITLDSYNERSRDYIETIKNSVSAVEQYKDALVSMYETQIKAENDALQDSIDLRKKLLEQQKKYQDYNKKLQSKNKDINSIKAQISALEGVFALSILIAGTS